MTISRTLSLVLALLAIPAFASPALGQTPGSTQEPGKPRTKAKRADKVKEAQPGTNPAKQDKKTAERTGEARDKQQAEKGAERAADARDKQQAEKGAERAADARDKQQAEKGAERAADARDKQQAEKGAERAADARAKMKALDTKALRSLGNQVKIHEANVARIDKLTEIFTRKKDDTRLAQVRKLRTAEDQRYEAIIGRFKNALGADRFGSVRARLETSKRKNKGR
ncbi:MAG: hypothetical protein ACI8QC_001257 [Planctomycetota bacterium]|jgi:hypothetical protein